MFYAPHPLWRTNSPPLDSQIAPGYAPRHKECVSHHEDVLRRYLYGAISTLIRQVRIEVCLSLCAAPFKKSMKPKTTINTTRIVRMYCLKWR
jgi:hypothetical protein